MLVDTAAAIARTVKRAAGHATRRRWRLILDASNVNPANLAQVKASGCVALISKATQAADFKDGVLAAERGIARKLRVPFGSYLFHDPSVDGAEQARFYLAYAKPRPGDLQPIIDAETRHNGEPWAQVAASVQACAAELEHAGYRPLLYGSTSFLQSLYTARPALRRLRVWQAEYPGLFARWAPRLAALRTRLRNRVTVVLWQFTDMLDVNSHRFDGSVLLANLDTLLIPAAKPRR